MELYKFLSSLSSPDGQKIAKRISSQIRRESRKVKKLVEEYNATSFLTESASEITVQTALNPDELMLLADTTNMATGVKHDIVHAYLQKVRSSEEIEILKEDMRNTLHYFQLKQECIKDACEDLSTLEDSFSRGARNLLTHLLWEVELCIDRSKQAFSTVSSDNSNDYESTDSECSDSNSECSDSEVEDN